MNPVPWAQIKDVVAEAMERPLAERASFVERACAGDQALRHEVDSLLAASDGPDSLPDVRAAVAGAVAEAFAAVPIGGPGAQERDAALIRILETALGQQYEIIRPLGRGGMGAVYLARERALERFVAIKVLRPDLANAPDNRERFRREARVVAQLSHPGILPLHTFGEVHGVWYFVMGYVRGVSLAERLRVEGRLPTPEAHRILTELVDAVECAHRHGVVHRDIKPGNILLDEESGHAVLADFGISKVTGGDDSLTPTGVPVGTPHFMSPEQSLGSPAVDERSDIYSIGAVGYTMLAGREPFAGMSAEQLTWHRLSHDPAPLDTVAPTGSDIAGVIMRCLARDPAARWPDARSLKHALARAGGDGLTTLPETLRDLPGFGPYTLLWAAFWVSLAVLTTRGTGDRALLVLIAFLVPLGFLLHVWNVGRYESGTLDLARIAFWPPQWWGMWWPSALRRPTDLWRRLPWQARMVRAVLSVFTLALAGMILFREQLEGSARRYLGATVADGFVTAEMMLILVTALFTSAALWWAWHQGLSRPDAVRVLFGATTPSPGWTHPGIARLLKPVTRSVVRAPDHDSPADFRRAIGELARTLECSPESIDRLARVLQSLSAEIDACDAQITSLSRVANARELDRLTTQVTALELEGQVPGVERQLLTVLLHKQIEVVRSMRLQGELLAQRRAVLFSRMRGLWTRVNQISESSPPAESGPGADARLVAVCEEVESAIPV